MIIARGKVDPALSYDGTGHQLPLYRRSQQMASNAKFYAICFECCDITEVGNWADGNWWITSHPCDGLLRAAAL